MRARAEELGIPPSSTICTGDVVAYCAEPEETTALVRDWGCHVIAGNCEEQLAAAAEDCACGFEEGSECDLLAKGWYPFANALLSPASRAWMAALPKTLTFTSGGLRFRVIHGGVDLINRFVFASERDVLAEELERAGADVVIAGHAGVPFIEKIGRRTWFNPGVIGMPANDGSADVWYGLIELDAGRIVLSTHRLAYDHVAPPPPCAAPATPTVTRARSSPACGRASTSSRPPSAPRRPSASAAAPCASNRCRFPRRAIPSPRLRGEGQGEGRPQAPTESGYFTSSPFSALAISARVFSTP